MIIFCLLPNTTADSQPLDTSCFGPLKTYWFETCCQYLFDNPGRIITKFQFSSLFAQAWSKGMTINNIVSEFHSAGKKEQEMTRIARGEEKKAQSFRKVGKKAEAEKNKKNKSAAKTRPVRPSDVANPKWQRIYEDECDKEGLQH